MTKVHTTAVVIIPPKDNWHEIQKIRKIHDRQFQRWMPHINLIYPFKPLTEFDNISEIFKVECKGIDSFNISLNQFSYFNHGKENYTLWLKPEPVNPLINLQLQLQKLVPEYNDLNKFKGGYKPHLSVGQVKGKDFIKNLILFLLKEWRSIKFTIKSIYFIARQKEKESYFEVIMEIPLKYSS